MADNQILNINGIDCYEKDGVAYLKLETVARGLGFTEIAGSGNECIRWRTVKKYLSELGIATSCDGNLPDYIPENIFYRLAMKAKNEAAEKFQAKVADEVIPSIRKHGAYITPNVVDQMIASPEFGIQLLTALKEERKKTAALQYENEQMLPKADYYDSFIHADASLSNFRDTAKQIGLPERAFINLLLDSEYIYRTTGRTREFRPNANKNAGYFVLKDFQASTGHVGKRTMITPQGKAHFSKIYRNIIEDFRINGKAIFKGGKNQ